jgi:hypothetical protein
MLVEARVTIRGDRETVWKAVTDIEKSEAIVRGIEKIEIVDRPAAGALVGLRWRETRILFDKPATAEKWITQATDSSFATRAENGGMVFITTHRIEGSDGEVALIGTHESIPEGIAASIKATPLFFFKGVIKKAILQDLNDIKDAVEGHMT